MPEKDSADAKIDPNAEGAYDQSATGDDTKSQDKLEFTKPQQEFLQRHTDDVFGRGFKKAEALFESKLAEAQARIAALEAETKKASPKPADDGDKDGDKSGDKGSRSPTKDEIAVENQRLKAQVEELQTGIKTLTTEREQIVSKLSTFEVKSKDAQIKDDFLASIPLGIQFFDPSEIFELTRKDLDRGDDGRTLIMNPKTGTPRLGPSFQAPMTLAEFIAEYAEKHPWQVKASDASGGTGSGEARRVTKPGAPPSVKNMSKEDFEAFINKVKARQA